MKYTLMALLLLGAVIPAQSAAIWATLDDEVSKLRGPVIRLGDIAKVQGTDSVLVAAARRLVLARQAKDGRARVITRETVERAWSRFADGRYSFKVVGPERVRVRAATTSLSESALRLLAKRHLATALEGKSGSPRLANVRVEGPLVALRGRFSSRYEVRLREDPEQASGLVHVDVVALADGKEVATATVKADLRREGRVVVTTRSISSGQTIESIDLELVERTLDSGRADWIRRPREVVGMVARTRIPKGRAILASQIKSPPVVFRRDDVVVEAHVGALLVEGRGRALEEGAVGDTIRVRMEPRNNLVLARVVDSRRVRLASQ